MGEIGPEKLVLLLLIILLLFGARRLPEIGQSLGKGIREFKRSVSDVGSPGRMNSVADAHREPTPDASIEHMPVPRDEEPRAQQRSEPKRLLE